MFTDKAKEKFEKWYCTILHTDILEKHHYDILEWFYEHNLSMQCGVIEDFAESEGFYISIESIGTEKYDFCICWEEEFCDSNYFNTRNEARLECIKQLNKLINDTSKNRN